MSDAIGKTIVVNKYKSSYDVYIGRGSIWGNLFAIGRDGSREEVIEKFRNYFKDSPDLQDKISEIRGKTLGCFCKPQACHGDILAKFADEGII